MLIRYKMEVIEQKIGKLKEEDEKCLEKFRNRQRY